MTKDEQKVFVNDLVMSILDTLRYDLPKVPDHWDGHELRQWITDRFAEQLGARRYLEDRRRRRDYNNDRLIFNI